FDQIDAAIGVAPLVVVPADELEEALVELDAGARVEDARMSVVDEVGGNHFVAGVSENAFEVTRAGCLESLTDFLVAGFFYGAHGQIDNGYRGRGHAERHAGK